MANSKELVEKRLQVAGQIKELGGKAKEWTAEDRAQWDTLNKNYNELRDAETAALKEEADAAAIQSRLSEVEQHEKEIRGDRKIGLDQIERQKADPETIVENRERDKALAFQAWLCVDSNAAVTPEHRSACQRLGFDPTHKELVFNLSRNYSDKPSWQSMGRFESRAGLDVTVAGAGKETIPAGFMQNLEERLLAYGGPRSVCQVIRTDTGNSLPWPTVNDTNNTGELLAEATTIGTSVDPTFAAVTFGAFKYSSKAVLVSSELLNDSAFNMASYVGSALGTRLGRITGAHTTTGTGTTLPYGVVTRSTASVTTAGATAITGDEIISLVHSLDPSYRVGPSVGFMLNDGVLAYLRKLKDGDGSYLWQPSIQMGVPDRLFGYPVTINQHMAATVVASAKTVVFGDFSKYIIRDVSQVRAIRMNERYADTDQVGFVTFMRMDADTIQAVALRLMTQHA